LALWTLNPAIAVQIRARPFLKWQVFVCVPHTLAVRNTTAQGADSIVCCSYRRGVYGGGGGTTRLLGPTPDIPLWGLPE
jgi:hypothetical protein